MNAIFLIALYVVYKLEIVKNAALLRKKHYNILPAKIFGFTVHDQAFLTFPTGSSSSDSESRATLFNLQIDYESLQEKYTSLLSEHNSAQTTLEKYSQRLETASADLGIFVYASSLSYCTYLSISPPENCSI